MNQQQLTSDDGARMQQQVPAPRATERASPHTVLRSRWFREPAAGSGLPSGPEAAPPGGHNHLAPRLGRRAAGGHRRQ